VAVAPRKLWGRVVGPIAPPDSRLCSSVMVVWARCKASSSFIVNYMN